MAHKPPRERAEQALALRTTQLEAVRAVTAEIVQEIDLTRLLELITQRAVDLVAGQGSIRLWDDANQVLVPKAWTGGGPGRTVPRLRLGEGVVGTVAQRREGLIVNDFRSSPHAIPILAQGTTHTAVLAEPLLFRDRLVGVIAIGRDATMGAFTEDDRKILALFADQAAIAIENAGLFEAAVRRGTELEALLRASRSLMSGLDLQTILDHLVTNAAVIANAPLVRVLLLDQEAETLYLAAQRGEAAARGSLPLESLSGLTARTGDVVYSDDVRRDPRNPKAREDQALNIVTHLSLPIRSGETILGVLAFNTTTPKAYSPAELAYLTAFADQAAMAIENARLHEMALHRAQQLATVNDLNQTLTTLHDPAEVAQAIVTAVEILHPGTIVQLWQWHPDTEQLHLVATAGAPLDAHPMHRLSSGQGLAGHAFATRAPVMSAELATDSRFGAPAWVAAERVSSGVALPLVSRTQVYGALVLFWRRPHPRLDEEIVPLRAFAAQAAIATENARLYETNRAHATELENRVRERTHALEAANQQLARASQFKSEFLANMSHELRTPLNAILGFAQLLLGQKAEGLSGKQHRFLTHIFTSGQHLLQLINDVLDLSKVEAGKVVLHPEPLSVRKVLEETLVIVRGLADKKELRLETAVSSDLPSLVADPVRLKQILFNLLSNAVKFTPERGQITVSVTRSDGAGAETERSSPGKVESPETSQDSAGDWLEMRVTDTGIGIKAEDMPRLFREFVQLEAAATKHHEGTGLGLVLTRRLVELHGGRIWAESEGAGRGACFVVRLPFVEVPAARVLVVDDEAPFRQLLSMILHNAGYRVQTAQDTSEAVRVIEADPPALVVLDLGLPPDGAGGWTVLAHLRDTERLRHVPVLILTGQDQIHAEDALARGASDFLGKPVSAHVLEETVARLLRRGLLPATA